MGGCNEEKEKAASGSLINKKMFQYDSIYLNLIISKSFQIYNKQEK
jgi:hypothetical protein